MFMVHLNELSLGDENMESKAFIQTKTSLARSFVSKPNVSFIALLCLLFPNIKLNNLMSESPK